MIELDRSKPAASGWRHRDYREAFRFAVGLFRFEKGCVEWRRGVLRKILDGKVQ